jgi:O-phosphoseryl-tRNA(Cys) synthetase
MPKSRSSDSIVTILSINNSAASDFEPCEVLVYELSVCAPIIRCNQIDHETNKHLSRQIVF